MFLQVTNHCSKIVLRAMKSSNRDYKIERMALEQEFIEADNVLPKGMTRSCRHENVILVVMLDGNLKRSSRGGPGGSAGR